MEAILIPAAITAIVKFIDLIQKKDYPGALKIVIAVAVGIIAGAASIQGLTPETGAYAGLVASGAVTIATRIGK
jgi:hypothetical protein